MRAIISSILVMLCGRICAQSSAMPAAPSMQPAYYIDSERVDFPVFWINPQDIAHINIPEKDKAHPHGAVYLTWKVPHPVFLSLGNISDKQTALTTAPILYIIDDSLIRDTANIRIEAANIFRVYTLNSAQTNYVPKQVAPVTLVLVETVASFSKKEPSRGQIIHLH